LHQTVIKIVQNKMSPVSGGFYTNKKTTEWEKWDSCMKPFHSQVRRTTVKTQ
jgi:hypothetical protein